MTRGTLCTSSSGVKKLKTSATAVTKSMTFLRPYLSADRQETTMKIAKNTTEIICIIRYCGWVNFKYCTP